MKALYLDDSYIREWTTKVKSVNNNFIVLEETAFYPNSGGQPYDEGIIENLSSGKKFSVVYVGKFSGEISHEVDSTGLKEGDKVKCFLDWNRRYQHMRMHTSCHIISSIFHQKIGALITGNQIGLEKSRIDFSLENYDVEQIKKYIELANTEIKKNHKVEISYLKREEALKDPSLVKLANILPPNIENLRIVTIGSVDRQADGGTHVKNTSEIGKIEFLKAENKGKNNRRVYFRLVE